MFGNYLRSALRSIMRQKLHAALNIGGLSVGLAACILTILFVQEELSYDKFWANSDRIYRLNTTFTPPGGAPFATVLSPGPQKKALENYFSDDVAAAARINRVTAVLTYKGDTFSHKFSWVDPEFLTIFNFKTVSGDLQRALADKSSLAVSQTFAQTLFGHEDAIDQILTVRRGPLTRDYRVAAVYQDVPDNSALKMEIIAAIDETAFAQTPWVFEKWGSVTNYLYFILKPNAEIKNIESQLSDFVSRHIPATDLSDVAGASSVEMVKLTPQALTDIHLHPFAGDRQEMKPAGNITDVVIFVIVAIFLLVIACINYMNLATARSTLRAREVAVRKVLGAKRGQLIVQFLGEAILTAALALILGVFLAELFLPTYSAVIQKDLDFDYFDIRLIGLISGVAVFVGIAGGVYPALVLSSYRPAEILKANKSSGTQGSGFVRSVLVTFQFAIAIGLMIATATVYGQRLFVNGMSPGFDKRNLLVIDGVDKAGTVEKQQAFREAVLRLQGAQHAAFSNSTPGHSGRSSVTTRVAGANDHPTVMIDYLKVDPSFLETYQMHLLSGRNYDRGRNTDGLLGMDAVDQGGLVGGTIIFNESAANRLGFRKAEDAIGKYVEVRVGGTVDSPVFASLEVIGVVADVPFHSLKETAQPTLYLMMPGTLYSLTARFTGDPQEFVQSVKGLWKAMMPAQPFRYEFVEEVLAEAYAREVQISVLLTFFSGLSILIACLGLYGLASFVAERRIKEIGIRKVLGAGVSDIVRLMIWQFSKPVLFANLVAWPLAVYGLLSWLEGFPYRIDSWLLAPFCLLSGIAAFVVASLSVGGKAAKAARKNPIKALRYE